MELYIGGYAQGKLDYVKAAHPGQEEQIVNEVHLWVKRMMIEGKNPEQEMDAFLEQHPDAILISDEIGNGIVPIDEFEREYRERLGRILIGIAAKAERVERIMCGIGQRIK
jgi:adenosyl cobinamide kinase/adenosyl cobinamide phosphate guanylyltransferase